jgi:sugar-phosphatase
MRLRVDAILFDSDGVLVDSHHQVDEAWLQLAAEFGLDIDTLRGELVGARAADTLVRHLPADRLDAAVARLEELEVASAVSTEPVVGAIELLRSLPTGAWTIVTSATRQLGRARWRGAGIPIPDRVVTAELVTAGKPDPEPFLAGAALLGRDPARCLVFEDSRPGGESAAAAGTSVVAVGGQAWKVEPVIRVADLTAVKLLGVDDAGLDLEVTGAPDVA